MKLYQDDFSHDHGKYKLESKESEKWCKGIGIGTELLRTAFAYCKIADEPEVKKSGGYQTSKRSGISSLVVCNEAFQRGKVFKLENLNKIRKKRHNGNSQSYRNHSKRRGNENLVFS